MEIFPDMGTEWVTQPTSITNPLVRVDMFVYRGKLPEFQSGTVCITAVKTFSIGLC